MTYICWSRNKHEHPRKGASVAFHSHRQYKISCIMKSKHKKVQMLIYFNTDTQYANVQGNPLYQATNDT